MNDNQTLQPVDPRPHGPAAGWRVSAAVRTSNPLRPKALGYLRDGRVRIWYTTCPTSDRPAVLVHAKVDRAPGDPSGQSVPVNVDLIDRVWECDEHPGENSCAHRLAVQMVTGYGHLGGRWQA